MENSVSNSAQPQGPHFGRVLLATVWPLAGYVVAALSVGWLLKELSAVWPVVGEVFSERSPFGLVLNAILSVLVFIIVVFPLYNFFFGAGSDKRQALGIKGVFKTNHAGFAVMAYVVYFVASMVAMVLAASFLPGFDIDQKQDLGFNNPEALWQLAILFVSLVIVPPVMEELIFRGFMFGALRRQLPFWPAALLVSAVFGFVHGQWNVGIDTFILSLFLCLLRERSGVLWPSMILHGLKNLVAFTLLFIVGVG